MPSAPVPKGDEPDQADDRVAKWESPAARRKNRRARNGVYYLSMGYNYTTIARMLGYASAASAQKEIEGFLAESVGPVEKQQARSVMNMSLMEMWSSISDKATDSEHPEQLAAQRNGLAILDRMAKLNGLDAPTELSITNPSAGELLRTVEIVLSRAQDADGITVIEHNPLEGFEDGPDQAELDRYDLVHGGGDLPGAEDRMRLALEGAGGGVPEEAGDQQHERVRPPDPGDGG